MRRRRRRVTARTGKPGAAPLRAARASLLILASWPAFSVVSAAAATPSLSVSVALPGAALTVGERAEAVITLRAPAGLLAAEPRFPVWRDAWGDAEVREHGEPRRTAGPDGTATFSQRLVLTAFQPGKVELPRLPIAVPLRSGTVQAWTPDHLALTVRSVLPAGAKDLRPRPPTPLRRLPLGAPFFAALAALIALAAAGSWLLWRRRRRRLAGAAPAAARLLAPYAELLAALDRLEADASRLDRIGGEPAPRREPSDLDRSGREPLLLAMHTGLSQAFRRYLGRTFAFPAPESTTSEIQRRLIARGWPSPQVRTAVELLRACDLVKFAPAAGNRANRANSLNPAPADSAPADTVPADTAAHRGRGRLATARRLAEECEARAAVEQAPARIEAAG
jgi:hypothetical protein